VARPGSVGAQFCRLAGEGVLAWVFVLPAGQDASLKKATAYWTKNGSIVGFISRSPPGLPIEKRVRSMNNPIKQNADLLGKDDVIHELIKDLNSVIEELNIQSKDRQLLINIVNLKISLNKFLYLLTEEEIQFIHNTAAKHIKLLHGINKLLVKEDKP
jgi:hypothetical protein